jgi:GNAT superfamily N-acetyltransferase
MEQIVITPIPHLQVSIIDHLVTESLTEGFRFLERLVKEYQSGVNRFDKSGEVLLIATCQKITIGIGGLNHDPYTNSPRIGRLRHLYVALAWRRQGVGRLLVRQLVQMARPHYQLLTLRTDTPAAAQFYENLDFIANPTWDHTSHYLKLEKSGSIMHH